MSDQPSPPDPTGPTGPTSTGPTSTSPTSTGPTAGDRPTAGPSIPYGSSAPATPAPPVAVGEGGLALRAALMRAVRLATLVCLAAGLVTAVVAGLVVGMPGVWGALLGFAIALGFLATTALVGARTAGGDPVVVAGWVLGSWLVKVVLVGVALFVLNDMTFYDPVSLFVGIVVGMVCTLYAEFRALTSAQIPYVDTSGR